jgi:hypothetical protein
VLVVIVVMAIIGWILPRGPRQTVKVVNDTQEPWTVCGSDCRYNDPELPPRATAVVHTRDGEEIFPGAGRAGDRRLSVPEPRRCLADDPDLREARLRSVGLLADS